MKIKGNLKIIIMDIPEQALRIRNQIGIPRPSCPTTFISGLSIAVGVGIGTIASRLFVPLIQIAYTTADQVLPLEIVDLVSDYIRILGVLGVVMICCLGVLSYIVSKIKISQALKLGED